MVLFSLTKFVVQLKGKKTETETETETVCFLS